MVHCLNEATPNLTTLLMICSGSPLQNFCKTCGGSWREAARRGNRTTSHRYFLNNAHFFLPCSYNLVRHCDVPPGEVGVHMEGARAIGHPAALFQLPLKLGPDHAIQGSYLIKTWRISNLHQLKCSLCRELQSFPSHHAERFFGKVLGSSPALLGQ